MLGQAQVVAAVPGDDRRAHLEGRSHPERQADAYSPSGNFTPTKMTTPVFFPSNSSLMLVPPSA